MESVPSVTEDGAVLPEQVQRLGGATLLDWIDRLLHGDAPEISAGPWSSPEVVLANVYDQVHSDCKQAIRGTLEHLISNMAYEDNDHWRGHPGHRLLLAAQLMCGDEIVRYLRDMIESEGFEDPSAARRNDLHFRLLQTLAAFDIEEGFEFWYDQAEKTPEKYLSVAFRGLSRSSVSEALRLICEPDWSWSDRLKREVRVRLDELVETRGSSLVERAVARYRYEASATTWEFLQPYSPSGGADEETAHASASPGAVIESVSSAGHAHRPRHDAAEEFREPVGMRH